MSLDEMLAKLKDEYVAELPQKIAVMETNLAKRDVAALRDDFHKIKGTGKTYGLPEVSDLGAVAEKLCVEKPEKACETLSDAISLLRDIHLERTNQKVLNLDEDNRFIGLQRFLNE